MSDHFYARSSFPALFILIVSFLIFGYHVRMRIPLPSIPLGSIAGTSIGLNLSVVFLVLVIAGESGFSGQQTLLFGLAVVASLVIHLLLHLAVGRLTGVPDLSREVILMPFGEMGLSRVRSSSPESSSRVSAAAYHLIPSLVHLIAASLLYTLFIGSASRPALPFAQDPIMHLFVIQAALGLLNLLPLEPLDMGRVFRQLMPQKPGSVSLSSLGLIRSGQLITMGVGLLCLWWGPFSLFLVCLMILAASIQIAMEETALLAASGLQAKEVMRPASRVDFFTHGVTVTSALRTARSSFQDVFPVVLQGRVVGLVDRRTLLAAAARADHQEQYVTEIASPPAHVVNPDTPVSDVLAVGSSEGAAVVVASDNNFEGIILPGSLSDVLIVGALNKEEPPDDDSPLSPFDG